MASKPPSPSQTAVKFKLVAAHTGAGWAVLAPHLSGMKALTRAIVSEPS